DNQDRIVLALRSALARSDAVIVCGGLGPTQDDITREAIAEVMNVPLRRDEAMVETIRAFFGARGREMAESNARQADLPEGATFIAQTRGTAPGLICPVGLKVRMTAKAPDEATARELLDVEETELRTLLGTLVFGVDEESMEDAVGALLIGHRLTLGVAESLTGGLVGARLTNVNGASKFF